MEPATTILGGIVIAVVSGIVGKSIGTNNNIKLNTCNDRQKSCQALLLEKIEHLSDKVDTLTKAVNEKVFGV